MANDLNTCSFIGRLGKDPEVRDAGSSRVANFTIAVGEQWTKNGEKHERTTWVPVTAWGDGLVGVIERYIKKGSRVYVQGKFQVREYEKDGQKRWATDIVLQGFDAKLIMLDGKSGGGSSGDGQSGGYGASSVGSGFADDDSDIPF